MDIPARQLDSTGQRFSVAFYKNEFVERQLRELAMCGIFAVLPAAVPAHPLVLSRIVHAIERLRLPTPTGVPDDVAALQHVQTQLTTASYTLSDPRAELRLLTDYSCVRRLRLAVTRLERVVTRAVHKLDRLAMPADAAERMAIQHGLIRIAATFCSMQYD